ncbi:anthrone oxygenase family protein [Nocardia sp. NPDC101769]|uniref:anthrone oxygenase family protein n=1 Tax=Nocardia sp. NPDC101769 TaxID=3364333 RepID=UPI00380C47A4
MYRTLAFLAILSAAMLVGLMTTLLTVMRGLWNQQSEADAARSFQDFLKHAGTNRVLSTLTIIPIISAIWMAFLHAPDTTAKVCALTGGGVFLLGFFIWTAVFNLPIYKAVDKWRLAEATPDDVRTEIRRFHASNLGRLTAATATSVLFFVAVF